VLRLRETGTGREEGNRAQGGGRPPEKANRRGEGLSGEEIDSYLDVGDPRKWGKKKDVVGKNSSLEAQRSRLEGLTYERWDRGFQGLVNFERAGGTNWILPKVTG